MKVDVAIVGGGLAGPALAVGLRRRGFDAHLFEANKQGLRTSTSTLIQLGGNAFTSLQWVHPDIVGKLKQVGARRDSVLRYTRRSLLDELCVKETNLPVESYGMRWSEVQTALASLLPSEAVHCGYKATGYTEVAEQGRVKLHFQDEADVSARVVVAADGVRSALRATMIPNDPGPRYLGDMNWNALLYNPDGAVIHAHDRNQGTHYCVGDEHTVDHTSPFRVQVSDAGGGWTFWQVRLRSEQPSFTLPTHMSDHTEGEEPGHTNGHTAAADNTGGHGHTGMARKCDQLMLSTRAAHLVGGGLGRPGSKARVMRILSEAGFDLPRRVVEATPESSIFERVLLDRIPLDELGANMYSAGHRVLLMGDAAHAMHSAPAQGGRTAFEDACTFGMLLEEHHAQLAACGWQITGTRTQQRNGQQRCAQKFGSSSSTADVATQSDSSTIAAIATAYQELRLARVCRIQRLALEACGIASLRDAVTPTGLTTQQYLARFQEFTTWLAQWPENLTHDPNSVYWNCAPYLSKPSITHGKRSAASALGQ